MLEGPRVIRQAVEYGVELDLLAVREGTDFDAPARRRVVLDERAFGAAANTETPQGVLATTEWRQAIRLPEALRQARSAGWPLVVLDGIQDPGNVGTIARSAVGFGAPALVVLPGTVVPWHPKVVRASAGHVFGARWALANDLGELRAVGAHPRGTPLDRADLEVDAIVFGSEAHGLSGEMPLVSVPTRDGFESLNVAAAAAVILYEISRRIAA